MKVQIIGGILKSSCWYHNYISSVKNESNGDSVAYAPDTKLPISLDYTVSPDP